MTLAEQIESLSGQLATANAALAASKDAGAVQRLTTENATLCHERDAATAEVATLRTRIAELDAANTSTSEVTAKLSAAHVEIGKLKNEILTTRADVDRRAAERAIEIMASVGQPFPVKADPKRTPDTDSSTHKPPHAGNGSALDRAVSGFAAIFDSKPKRELPGE